MTQVAMVRTRTWGAAFVAALAMTLLTGSVLQPAGAATVPVDEAASTIMSQTNQHRAANGASALKSSADIDAVAQAWAEHMASTGTLAHNPDYSKQIPSGWRSAGENVAYNCGYSSPAVKMMDQWKNSPGHNRNMLNTSYTHMGIGWATDSRGCSWGVQVFAQYPSSITTESSTAALPSSPQKFSATTKPQIYGTTRVGRWLNIKMGEWTPSAEHSYQWRRDGRNIRGATKHSYRLTVADLGHEISVVVTGKRDGYEPRVRYADRTAAVSKAYIQVPVAKVTGKMTTGGLLKVRNPDVAPGGVKRVIEWRRDGKIIRGQDHWAYRLTPADRGARITAKVTFSKPGYRTKTEWLHRYPGS